MQSKLKLAERRGNMLDWLLIGIFSTFLIVCFVIAYRWQAHVDSAVANIAGAVIFTLFAGYPVLVVVAQ